MGLIDEKQFKQFYTEAMPQVRTFIHAKCKDLELAQDIAQESFVKLWNNKEKIELPKAKSYLFTVANNLFYDHTRHQKVVHNYESIYRVDRDHVDPQYQIEMQEFKQKLDRTIDSMPDGVREVFLLSRVEKMTYAQIADSLELTVKAIEKRMQRALEIIATLNVPKF
jgi:RNA polymerase sigma-70 factor (family 1)